MSFFSFIKFLYILFFVFIICFFVLFYRGFVDDELIIGVGLLRINFSLMRCLYCGGMERSGDVGGMDEGVVGVRFRGRGGEDV